MTVRVARGHWGIENKLHWVLDISFREDECKVRKGNTPKNYAVLRHIALNILKQDNENKVGTQNQRLTAGWDTSYLDKLLL